MSGSGFRRTVRRIFRTSSFEILKAQKTEVAGPGPDLTAGDYARGPCNDLVLMRGIPTEEESMIESGCFLTLNPKPYTRKSPYESLESVWSSLKRPMPKKQKPPSPALT